MKLTLGFSMVALTVTALAVAAPAVAAQFPVSGTVVLAGNTASLPSSTFGDSTYNATTGYLSSGTFAFPQSSFSNVTYLGTLTVTYQLSQTNTTSAQVGSDGNVAFTEVDLKLHIVSASLGTTPISVGSTCDFAPIVLAALGGTASSTSMTVSQTNLVVPQTTDSCGGWQSNINNIIANSTGNSITLTLQGDFTPPPDDTIFKDGFDGP